MALKCCSVAGTPLTTIDLGPLRLSEAEVLASAYRDTLGDLAQRCIERAAGNPLFLDQLLRHAEESVDSGVPGSIQSLIQARLDRLAPSDKQALQAASVLGQRFAPEALGALLDQPGHAGEEDEDWIRRLRLGVGANLQQQAVERFA